MNILNKIPKKNEDLAWRVIENEAIVIPLKNQPKKGKEVVIFNETGARIWELVSALKLDRYTALMLYLNRLQREI